MAAAIDGDELAPWLEPLIALGHRRAAGDRRECRADSLTGQDRRVDAMRDGAQLVDGVVDVDAEALEHCPLLGSIEPLAR